MILLFVSVKGHVSTGSANLDGSDLLSASKPLHYSEHVDDYEESNIYTQAN